MVPTVETKISSPSTVIKIVTDVQPEKNAEYFEDRSRELEKGSREYKESSSTQTSSSSSLLHKRKMHSYYDPNGFYRPLNNYKILLNRPKRNTNSMSQRIISAKFLKIKQLQNELTEAHKKITNLQEENRTLKNIHKRQDSALRKYESQDAHLPQLLKSHEEEMRVITLKYKKLRTAHVDLESRYNKQYSELMSMKDRYKHLLVISQDKHLLEREQLSKQIDEMKIVINEMKNKIKLQSRRLDLETKNHKYQLSIEFNKLKCLQDQLRQSEENIQKLQSLLKDKERYIANFKINQRVSTQVNQMKLKLPFNSLKPIRKCLEPEENMKEITTTKIKKENGEIENCLQEVIGTVVKGSTEIAQNVFTNRSKFEGNIDYEANYLDSKFELDITPHSYERNLRSDNNNNVKQNRESEIFDNQKSVTIFDSIDTINYSFDNCDSSEKYSQNESNSEKSEDFNPIDETSWLELHEKLKEENEQINQKWDQFCDSFASQKYTLSHLDKNILECNSVNVDSETDEKHNLKSDCFYGNKIPKVTIVESGQHRLNEQENKSVAQSKEFKNELSEDKKSTLLSILREIDLEKNNTNASSIISYDKNIVERKIKNLNHRGNQKGNISNKS